MLDGGLQLCEADADDAQWVKGDHHRLWTILWEGTCSSPNFIQAGMRYLALATDYDGTIAHHGGVDPSTIDALTRLSESGRKLILVTGRELPDILKVFPGLEKFHYVVAENGALLYRPETREEKCIAEPPSPLFLDELRRRNVPFSVGKSIVATVQPHESVMLEVIRDLGLELHLIFNKGAVMVLPSGMNKGVGLKTALREMGLSPRNVVGVGDAENDHAFLSICECSASTANAIDTLKQRADIVLQRGWGDGVSDLIEALIEDDLRSVTAHVSRHRVLVGAESASSAPRLNGGGEHAAPNEVRIEPFGSTVLVAGPSGSGKSTAVTGVLERLQEAGYQFCLVDPEGDYENFPDSVCLGNAQHAPTGSEVLDMLDKFNDTVVNLLGIKLGDRPQFFAQLLPKLQELRARTGRPHWLVIDEAHHLLPAGWSKDEAGWLREMAGTMMITVHPEMLAPSVVREVNTVLAVGQDPDKTLHGFSKANGAKIKARPAELEQGEVLMWAAGESVRRVKIEPARTERLRHRKKYAAGDVHEKSFYFRGPEGRLKLRAQNLNVFVQMAEGVDDDTWEHHLGLKHYSEWVRRAIKDPELAGQIEEIEAAGHPPDESRKRIFAAIEERYTGAA